MTLTGDVFVWYIGFPRQLKYISRIQHAIVNIAEDSSKGKGGERQERTTGLGTV
jgi:hypothetical protein